MTRATVEFDLKDFPYFSMELQEKAGIYYIHINYIFIYYGMIVK
jgi:hypothetical protein